MKTISLLLIFFPIVVLSQNTPDINIEDIQSGLESITQSDIAGHLSFLASAVAEGRGTGQRGLQVAAQYIASQFKRYGLTSLNSDGSYFQKYELMKTKLGINVRLALLTQQNDIRIKESFQYKDDFFLSIRGLTGSIELQAPVVYAGYGIIAPEYNYDDYSHLDVENKIVLVIDGEPEFSDTSRFKGAVKTHFSDVRSKLKTAKDLGASALLVASNPKTGELFTEKYNRWEKWLSHQTMVLPTPDQPVPLIIINERTADRILSGIETTLINLQSELEDKEQSNSIEFLNRHIHVQIDIEKEMILAQNVAGFIPGSDPEVSHETIIISAHYDHIGINEEGTIWYGADDNGTGTSSLLEIAEAVASNHVKPRRSFLFLAVSGEEKGLLGSRYYVSRPLIPLDRTITDLNTDMVGRNAPDSVYIIGSNMINESLQKISEHAFSFFNDIYPDYKYNTKDDPNRFYFRSDHYNFAERGIPVIFYFAGIHDDYHKPTDTIEKINVGKVRKIARLVFLTAWGVSENGLSQPTVRTEYPEIPDQIKY